MESSQQLQQLQQQLQHFQPHAMIQPLQPPPQVQEAHSTTSGLEGKGDLDGDKKAIYRHPLFPLMALLFEKCERATQTPDCPSADSFDVDIQAFVQHQEQDQKPFFSDDPELDNVMVKAIQVLRIHLLELEKVSDLCQDFCNRYTACLKGKLHSENLLRQDGSSTDPDSTNPELVFDNRPQNLAQGQVMSGGRVFQMVQTAQGLIAHPLVNGSPVSSSSVQGSTPLSQIGVQAGSPPNAMNPMSSPIDGLHSPSDLGEDDFSDDKNKNKRGVLPKQATQVMKKWLFQHIMHPYPSEDEKRQIAGQTNLTLLQVNNWFINARRRILQPMLDASLPEGSKPKKNKQQSRPPQRFWPDNLANLQSPDGLASSQSSSPNSQGNFSADEDSDSVDIPTPQDIFLPPGVTVTSDCKIIPTPTMNFMGASDGMPPSMSASMPPLMPMLNSNPPPPLSLHQMVDS